MSRGFETFQELDNSDLVQEMVFCLQSNNIPYQLEGSSPLVLDEQIIGTQNIAKQVLKLRLEDFAKAQQVLMNYFQKQVDGLPLPEYMESLHKDEFLEVVENPVAWGFWNVAYARKGLALLGHPISDEQMKLYFERAVQKETASESIAVFWLAVMYVMALLFPPFALVWSGLMRSAKKTLSDGRQIHRYNSSVRTNALYIFMIALVIIVLWLAIQFTKQLVP